MMATTVVLLILHLTSWLCAANNATIGEMTFDPMTSSPRLTFTTAGQEDSDREEPDYVAIVSTADGNYLLMVDDANWKVKVMTTSSGTPSVTSSVKLSKKPWDIALLPDGMVAVTTNEDYYVYLLRLEGDVITLTSTFRTDKKYAGVTAGLDNDTLLVTTRGYLDVITRDGEVVESFEVRRFTFPDYLCRAGGDDVIVPDWPRGWLFRVSARTGEVKEILSHPELVGPHQAVVDKGGNLYVACRKTRKVLVMSPDGEWRTLLEGSKRPTGISVTSNDVIVSWSELTLSLDAESQWDLRIWSLIKGYSMTDDVN